MPPVRTGTCRTEGLIFSKTENGHSSLIPSIQVASIAAPLRFFWGTGRGWGPCQASDES